MRLIHSVASRLGRCAQLERHARARTEVLVEVNVAGEEAKAGVAPDELGAFLGALPGAASRAS